MRTTNQSLVKSLRRNSTSAEKKLWHALRNRQLAGCKFRRQQSYGPYILDFYCAEARVVIELDGNPHGTPNQVIHDGRRDSFLQAQDLTVLRFWNFQVADEFDAVLETIYRALQRQPLTRTLSPRRGEGAGSRNQHRRKFPLPLGERIKVRGHHHDHRQ
jgi:very-short-patch-repair endonuclease